MNFSKLIGAVFNRQDTNDFVLFVSDKVAFVIEPRKKYFAKISCDGMSRISNKMRFYFDVSNLNVDERIYDIRVSTHHMIKTFNSNLI